MKIKCFIAIIPFLAASCSYNDAQLVDVVSLGARVKTVTVDNMSGQCSFDVLSNVPFSAEILGEGGWLSFDGTPSATVGYDGDAVLSLNCNANRSFRRMALVVLSAPGRTDTLRVKQEGSLDEIISLSVTSIAAPAGGGDYEVRVRSNVLRDNIRIEADSRDVGGIVFKDGVLRFSLGANTGREDRTVTVSVFTIDGWGEKAGSAVTLTQPVLAI